MLSMGCGVGVCLSDPSSATFIRRWDAEEIQNPTKQTGRLHDRSMYDMSKMKLLSCL